MARRSSRGSIQQLRKPAMAAWVVNMLVRHHADEMTQVLELGVSLREAQADLDGDALRELTRQRRQLIAAMTTTGRRLAVDLGEKVSDSVARQVEDTLHAAMVDEEAATAVRSGVLTEPLESTGLGTLDISEAVADGSALGRTATPATPAAAAPSTGRADLSVVPEHEPGEDERAAARQRARAEAQAALDDARARAEKAEQKLDKATGRAEKLAARSLQLQGEMEELRRQVAELEHRQDRLDEEIEEADAKRERAAARHADAAAAVEDARAELDRWGR